MKVMFEFSTDSKSRTYLQFESETPREKQVLDMFIGGLKPGQKFSTNVQGGKLGFFSEGCDYTSVDCECCKVEFTHTQWAIAVTTTYSTGADLSEILTYDTVDDVELAYNNLVNKDWPACYSTVSISVPFQLGNIDTVETGFFTTIMATNEPTDSE